MGTTSIYETLNDVPDSNIQNSLQNVYKIVKIAN